MYGWDMLPTQKCWYFMSKQDEELESFTVICQRYLLFEGFDFYPEGGALDFVGAYTSLQKAKNAEFRGTWAHIFDLETLKIVSERTREGVWEDVS